MVIFHDHIFLIVKISYHFRLFILSAILLLPRKIAFAYLTPDRPAILILSLVARLGVLLWNQRFRFLGKWKLLQISLLRSWLRQQSNFKFGRETLVLDKSIVDQCHPRIPRLFGLKASHKIIMSSLTELANGLSIPLRSSVSGLLP